jgi:hypothetical protein
MEQKNAALGLALRLRERGLYGLAISELRLDLL